MFQFRHINRYKYPQKHILICEDNLNNQKRILEHFLAVFEPEGDVQFSIVPGGLMAAAIINSCNVDVILLDHDMPQGNGADLLQWMKNVNKNIPVITFSGIPQNNHNMMAYGASHLFGKEDVINGGADPLIKSLLKMNSGIAEYYTNTISPINPIMARYWIVPNLLVGGNVVNQQDWEHLERDFGIKAVINVDGHPDTGKGITNLLECYVPDEGAPFPANYVHQVIDFAKTHSASPIYLHCHAGISRSPHFAYAILRGHYKMSPEQALNTVKNALPISHHHGFHIHTTSYIKSIEEALANRVV